MSQKRKLTLQVSVILLLALLLTLGFWSNSAEANQDVSDVQSELNDAQAQVEELKEEKAQIETYLDELSEELEEINGQLNNIETQITEKQEELELTQGQLEEAQEKESIQYEEMKLRIQYMYEQGDYSTLEIIMTSASLSEMLNNLEYIYGLAEYDQQMFVEYRNTKELIAEKEAKLLEDEQILSQLKIDLTEKQDEILVSIQNTQDKINAYIDQITEGENQAAKKAALIQAIEEEQREMERQIEASRDASESLSIAESKQAVLDGDSNSSTSNENTTSNEGMTDSSSSNESTQGTTAAAQDTQAPQTTTPTTAAPTQAATTSAETTTADSTANATDLDLLAAIIQCEAGAESYEGKVAVGNVVLNRVNSSRYPNTVLGVISQPYQFTPYMTGKFAIVLASGANSACRQAAQAALNGESYVGSSLYFRTKASAINIGAEWIYEIGGHVFW